MDLRQLRYFIAVVEARTFVGAAAKLHISQPALSKAIRSLEQSLGVTLIERGAREVTLTTFGKSLYSYAKAITAEVHRAHNELQALRSTPSGTVTVGSQRPTATTFLPEATRRFLRGHPTIRVKVIVDFTHSLIKGLAQGELDFVVVPIQENLVEKGFLWEPLAHDRLCIVCRYGHPLTEEHAVTPAMLRDFPWVLPGMGSPNRRRLEDMFYAAGISAPIPMIESTFLPYIRGIVRHTDYLGLLSRGSIEFELETKILAALPVRSEFMSRPLGIVTRTNHILPHASTAFLAELRAVAAEEAALAAAS